jgi:outer membrane beta-barrel protein
MQRTVASFIVAITMLTTCSALAEGIKDAEPIRKQILWREFRHELSPFFGLTLGDHYRRTFLNGLRYDFHVFDWLSVGVDLGYGLAWNTSTGDQVETKLSTEENPFELPASNIQFFGDFILSMAPISGKFVILNQLGVAWDFHIDVGVGYFLLSGTGSLESVINNDPGSITPIVGGGLRLFVTRGIAIKLSVMDYFLNRIEAGAKAGTTAAKGYDNNFAFLLGVSFMLPPKAKITK